MLEYYTSRFNLKTLPEDGEFEGYASVFNVEDLHGDIIERGAFSGTLDRSQNSIYPKLLWQHDECQPIGIWKYLREDEHGLFVHGKLLLDIPKAQEVYTLLKNDAVDGLSIGYKATKIKRDGNKRRLVAVDLFEISIVTFAANQLAKITRYKRQTFDLVNALFSLAKTIRKF